MSPTIRLFLVSLAISFSLFANAKSEKDTEINMDKKGFTLAEDPSEDYKNAELLAFNAIDKLSNGDVIGADLLIRKSISLYPTKAVYKYVEALFLMPDFNKANLIMDELYKKVQSLSANKILMLEPFASAYENGKMVAKVKEYEKERALFHFGYEEYKINKAHGGVKRTEKTIEKLVALNINNTAAKTSFDFEYAQLHQFKIDLAVLQRDFNKAVELQDQIPVSTYYPKETKDLMLAYIYQESGDYNKSLKIIETVKGFYILPGYKLKFMIYALMGNIEESLSNYEKYIKEQHTFISNEMFYYLALNDLTKKDYNHALVNLDSVFNYKINKIMVGQEVLYIDKWKVYKLMGDAYAGLQQFEKAKDNYTLSLLFYPEYEPAQKALLQLGSQVSIVIETDKTSPVILITEPATNRGLEIVSAGNDILVKGTAADPSGLKSVTINGVSVYAQPDGNFWGNIPLKDGLNKITVIATDGAGNATEQVFEIEKNSKEPVNEVVAVTEREGKNYCLLIGAQNYADSNIPSLENPIQDAVRLKIILKSDYDFEDSNIITLFNPEANDIKRQLLELTNIIQPEDNLLIFYAGHGIWVEKEKKGYWLLVDAKRNDPNTWLQNKDVLNLIAKLPSRHTLLITDACFSGGVFKTRSIGKDAPTAIQSLNEKISRVAITSGNDTEVPDESVFMKYLIKALTDNKEQYLTAQKMFITQIMEAVMTETKTEPRYGTLELAGHVGGDYIFSKK